MRSARAFAIGDWKLIVAGLFAAACLALLVIQLIPNRSERTDVPKPMVVRADGTAVEPPSRRERRPEQVNWEGAEEDEGRSYAFERVSNASDVREQMDHTARTVNALQGDDADAPESLGARAVRFLEPLNSGDEAKLREAVTALGGSLEPNEDGEIPTERIFPLFAGLMEFAALDTSNIIVRSPTHSIPDREGIAIGMNRDMNVDPETGEEVETISSTIEGLPKRLFPQATAPGTGGNVVELRLPFLSKGSKSDAPDVIVNLHMRDVPGIGWQPAGFVVDVRNQELMDEVMAAVMARRGG